MCLALKNSNSSSQAQEQNSSMLKSCEPAFEPISSTKILFVMKRIITILGCVLLGLTLWMLHEHKTPFTIVLEGLLIFSMSFFLFWPKKNLSFCLAFTTTICWVLFSLMSSPIDSLAKILLLSTLLISRGCMQKKFTREKREP